MTVEVQILSGSRQGERVTIHAPRFRVGADTGCEVWFDPQTDPGAAQRAVVFRQEGQQWIAEPLGREGVLLDQVPLVGPQAVRSGQVLGLSDQGPDVILQWESAPGEAATQAGQAGIAPRPSWMVGPLSPEHAAHGLPGANSRGASQAPPAMPAHPPAPTPGHVPHPAPGSLPVAAAEAVPAPSPSLPAVPPQRVRDIPPQHPPVSNSSQAPPQPPRMRAPVSVWPSGLWLGLALGLLALCLLFLFGCTVWWWLARTSDLSGGGSEPIIKAEANHAVGVPDSGTMPANPAPDVVKPPETKPAGSKPPETKSAEPSPQPETGLAGGPSKTSIVNELRLAVYLLQVELQRGGSATIWPFATCCAIEPKTLITSGTVGCEILRFRQQGFRIWAVHPQQGTRQEIRETRILAEFVRRIQDPMPRRCYDLALLEVDTPLEHPATLADAAEIARLEEGMPLTILGYPHEGNKVTRYDKFPLEEITARVFLVKMLPPPGPDAGRSLDVTAPLKPNCYGSPVFDAGGKLVGIFTESPGEQDARAVKDLQHVAVVSPEAIRRWLRDRDTSTWIVPEVQEAPAKGDGTAREF